MTEQEISLILNVMDKGISLAFLLGAVFWFKKRDEKKDSSIEMLNKELRDSLEKNLNKTNDAIVNNTMALTAFKEALKNA